jgi:hypothetical protein
MPHDLKTAIGHGLHVVHNTHTGKKAMHSVASSAIAAGAAVLTPIVGSTAAPFVAAAAIGYGLYRLFKKK